MCSSLHGRLEQTLTISNNRKMFKHCFQHRHRKNRFRNTSTQKSIESVIYLAQERTFRWIFLQLSIIETSDRHGSVCRTRMRFLADSYQLVSRVQFAAKKTSVVQKSTNVFKHKYDSGTKTTESSQVNINAFETRDKFSE